MNLMEHTEFSLLRLKFFLAWLETFYFFVKMCDDTFVLFEALHRTESELLRSGPSQRTGRSAVVYGAPRSEAPKFVVRNEDERRFVFTKVLSIFARECFRRETIYLQM